MGQVVGLAEGLPSPQDEGEKASHLKAVHVAHAVSAAVGDEEGPSVREPKEVGLEASAVVEGAIHHGDADPGGRESVPGGGRERVLAVPLADAVLPVGQVLGVAWPGQKGACGIALLGGDPAGFPHQVHLAEEIMR